VRLSFAVIIIILNSAFVLYFLYKMYYNMKSTVMRVLINFNWREDSADENVTVSSMFRKIIGKSKEENKVSDDEASRASAIQGLFYRYDTYFDGALGPLQVKQMMCDLCKDSDTGKSLQITESDAQEFISHLDMDGDNEIQCNEFILFMSQGLGMDEEAKEEYGSQGPLHEKIVLLLGSVERHIEDIDRRRKLKKASEKLHMKEGKRNDASQKEMYSSTQPDLEMKMPYSNAPEVVEVKSDTNTAEIELVRQNQDRKSNHESYTRPSSLKSFASHDSSNVLTKYELGDYVWVVQEDWGQEVYAGTVKGIGDGNLYYVLFEDGEERYDIPEMFLFSSLEAADKYVYNNHTNTDNVQIVLEDNNSTTLSVLNTPTTSKYAESNPDEAMYKEVQAVEDGPVRVRSRIESSRNSFALPRKSTRRARKRRTTQAKV